MNLNEQVTRIKSLMGVQPLNEGIFKQSGNFKDLFSKIFGKNNSEEEPIVFDNIYQNKYGNIYEAQSNLELITLNLQTIEQDDPNQNYCTVSILTTTPQPLPSDQNKNTNKVTSSVKLSLKTGSTETFYQFIKTLFYIDGQQTDELSSIKENNNEVCNTSTLDNKGGGCQFSQEIKDKILTLFKEDKEFTTLQSYLDRIN